MIDALADQQDTAGQEQQAGQREPQPESLERRRLGRSALLGDRPGSISSQVTYFQH